MTSSLELFDCTRAPVELRKRLIEGGIDYAKALAKELESAIAVPVRLG